MTSCKICKSDSDKILDVRTLNKYDVSYFKCPSCEFIQTEEPFWLAEAYSSAITSLDIGLIRRNQICAPLAASVINFWYDNTRKFLDYGGGYGMFVRMMRDSGFDFYRQDLYCENLFSKNFDITDAKMNGQKFELLTAFEVFEHLTHPMEELEIMSSLSENIFFSTITHDSTTDLNKWWYVIPETGQHIALYSKKTLLFMAQSVGMNFYSRDGYHLFSKKKISKFEFNLVFNPRFQKVFNKFHEKETLLYEDYNSISSRPINRG